MCSLQPAIRFTLGLLMTGLVMGTWPAPVRGQVDGFLEPLKRIELSSDESGSIAEMLVEEGDRVVHGQAVARLDQRAEQIRLRISQQMAGRQSQWLSASRLLAKRREILDRLTELRAQGHATASEILRGEMEVSIAEAKLLAAEEEQQLRKLEADQARIELEQRTITAPFSGLIAKVHRREGEFVSPLHPEVVTIIQVDQLVASFAIPSSQADLFEPGAKHELQLASGEMVVATVNRVGVEIDAQSSTIEVRLIVDNPGGRIRSGERVVLNI